MSAAVRLRFFIGDELVVDELTERPATLMESIAAAWSVSLEWRLELADPDGILPTLVLASAGTDRA